METQITYEQLIKENAAKNERILYLEALLYERLRTDFQLIAILKEFAFRRNQETFLNLSKREIEVLQLVCAGLSNEQIAAKLFIEICTVESHRKNIRSVINVPKRASLVAYAFSCGLIIMPC
jgi:DNA-binding CsgD family transcriptional regulator